LSASLSSDVDLLGVAFRAEVDSLADEVRPGVEGVEAIVATWTGLLPADLGRVSHGSHGAPLLHVATLEAFLTQPVFVFCDKLPRTQRRLTEAAD